MNARSSQVNGQCRVSLIGGIYLALLAPFLMTAGFCESAPPRIKEYVEKYVNGRDKISYSYYVAKGVDTLKQGIYRSWHANGKLAEERGYADGKLDGEWNRWDTAGNLYHVSSWTKETLHGRFRGIESDTLRTGCYKNGVKSGRWVEGKSEGCYVDGKRDGVWVIEVTGGSSTKGGMSPVYVVETGAYMQGVRTGRWLKLRGAYGVYAYCVPPNEYYDYWELHYRNDSLLKEARCSFATIDSFYNEYKKPLDVRPRCGIACLACDTMSSAEWQNWLGRWWSR